MRKLLVAIASAAALLSAGHAYAQAEAQPSTPAQTPEQGPTFRTGVEVIAVDVAVVDGRGRPVEDLRAPEFAVKIDGQPRRVVSAEQIKIDVEAAKKEAAEEKGETLFTTNLVPSKGRMIVIAVDQLNIRPGAVRPLLA